MATHLTPALRADMTYSVPVHRDRFARQDERSQRNKPLMRKFEIASLLPDGSARTSHHLAPATPVFEATSSAFARGTMIATPSGPVAIEDLWPGDLVDVQDGNPAPVKWIASTTYVPAQSSAATTLTHLTRVLPDAQGGHIGCSDLLLGPAARLLQKRAPLEEHLGIRSVLTPVRDFVDGYSVLQITPPSPVRVFHIRLDHHSVIFAGGRPVETYHPGTSIEDDLGASAKALFLSLFPDIAEVKDFGSLAYPRMSQATLNSLVAG